MIIEVEDTKRPPKVGEKYISLTINDMKIYQARYDWSEENKAIIVKKVICEEDIKNLIEFLEFAQRHNNFKNLTIEEKEDLYRQELETPYREGQWR